MKIKDGLKLEPTIEIPGYGKRVVEIPDVGRDDFATFLYEYGYRVGVEIGIDKGEYGITLCKAGLKVYGIDPFENYKGYKRVGTYKNHYEDAAKNLKGYDYTIIGEYSINASIDFLDNSLDFVYIDANHTLPHITADIFAWERKVKRGGIISGHDYAFVKGYGEHERPMTYDGVHVKAAVDACVYIMRIPKLYVLGEKLSKNRDKWRSWFFFRP